MMNNKVLSIIVPTYNMEKYLRKCLNSLIVSDEGMKLLEVLVINDGSKDSSSQIAHEYEVKYPQTFKVIDKENGNYGSCINRGLNEITGKYVKILDADDYYDTDELDKFIYILNNINVDLVLSNTKCVSETGKELHKKTFDLPHNTELKRRDIDSMRCFLKMQMHCITYNMQIFDSLNYIQSEKISYTDQEWIFTPMYKVETVYVTDCFVYQYLKGRAGQTMNPHIMIQNISHTIKGVLKMVKDYGEMHFNNDKEKIYFRWHIIHRLKYVYKNYLLIHYKTLDSKDLHDVENTIKKQSIEVFNWIDNITLFKDHIKFVKIWHKNPKGILYFFTRTIFSIVTKRIRY